MLFAVTTFAGAATADAHELTPAWGYAYIDDNPFNDPFAGNALLPATQAFPRGRIRDALVDNKDVRLTVSAFRPGSGTAASSYKVEEDAFRDVAIDRRLDIAPNEIAYLRFDFCRFNPSSGAVEVCEPSLTIARPTPAPAPPQDADGDGWPVPADCWDQNATVHPGAPEVPGNGIDDDCVGGDAPGRLVATIKNKWVTLRKRVRLDALSVLDAPAGARVEVTCSGRRCPFKRRATTVKANGRANLRTFFKQRKLRPRITIDIRITSPNTIGRVGRFAIRRVAIPNLQRLCLPPGAKKPARCA